MINLEEEKNLAISAQDTYDIISFALQEANDGNGFINSYVFERMLKILMIEVLYEDDRSEIQKKLSEDSILVVWNDLITEGYIDKLLEDYSSECDYVDGIASVWFEDYSNFKKSAAGIFSSVQTLAGNGLQDIMGQFSKMASNENANKIINIADKYGFNNDVPTSE